MKHLYFSLFLITICFYSIAQNAPLKIRLEMDDTRNTLHIFFVNLTDSTVFVKQCFDFQSHGEFRPNIDISFKRKGTDKYWIPIASEYIPIKEDCFVKLNPGSEVDYSIDLTDHFREKVSLCNFDEIKVDIITDVMVGYKMYNNSKISGSLCISKPCQDSKYDFKNFVNSFPDLKLPFQSNVLYSLSVANSIEKNTVNYFIFYSQKANPSGEYPKIRQDGILRDETNYLGLLEDGMFYPVGRIDLNPNYISLIAKTFPGELGFFELYNFSKEGKCLSAILLSKYSTGSSPKDTAAFIYDINSEIQKDGSIYWNEDYFSEREIYQTIRLAEDGYFELLHEYIRYPQEPNAICDKNSLTYDKNSCAQTICDQLHPNYNPQACALSRIDPSSPNFDPSLFNALFYHLSLPFLR